MISTDYLRKMLKLFELDPADSDYQRGYEAALRELLQVAEQSENAPQ